jgi:hypothetical protein
MRPQKQTDLSHSAGNALQACVATLLSEPMSQVPNFILASDPYASLRTYLAPRGLGFVKVALEHGRFPFIVAGAECLCVLAGPSPRGDFRHAVVGKCAAHSDVPLNVFDPHPSDDMLAGPPVWAGVFISLNPAVLDPPAP